MGGAASIMAKPSIRVYIATSLDNYITGPNNDLTWIPQSSPALQPEDHGYEGFLRESTAILMGRNTYEVIKTFDRWLYGNKPIYVATNRPLIHTGPGRVIPISGNAIELINRIRQDLGDNGKLYIDGGKLIRSFVDAQLVHEITISIIPVVLGQGTPLFSGISQPVKLCLQSTHAFPSGVVQVKYRMDYSA
jgi:dihydrofolate reductase